MSLVEPQKRDDEGGGGRFLAIADFNNMDQTAFDEITPASQNQTQEEENIQNDVELNNKRSRVHEVNDTSRQIKPRLDTQEVEASDAELPQRTTAQDNTIHGNIDADDTVSNHIFVIELVGISKTENLINDKATLRYMINSSPIGLKSSGDMRFQPATHKIILHITNSDDIEELLKIVLLTNEEEDWPIVCRRAQVNQGLSCLGVIKGIHPSVKPERVKTNLRREGVDVIEATRITNYRGNTFCIKLKFHGSKKTHTVIYDGYDKVIHPFIPPTNTLLCHKCGKGGHRALNCNTSATKCPICSSTNHERADFPKDTKKCPNCGEGHTANYHKCPYLIREKEITKIRLYDDIPRHRAINVWEERARQRATNVINPTFLKMGHHRPH